jgi:hypothetical protein
MWYAGNAVYRTELGTSKFLISVARIYTHPDAAIMLAFIGFIVGLLVCRFRISGNQMAVDKTTEKHRPRFRMVLVYSMAGALALLVLSQGLGRTNHWWLFSIRDTLFGALLGIAISEMRPSALWSIRPGERARSFLAHAATGAAIAMVSSGAILSSIGGFYPQYYEFYFEQPMFLAPYGFFVGAIVYLVRIFRWKLRTGSTGVAHK